MGIVEVLSGHFFFFCEGHITAEIFIAMHTLLPDKKLKKQITLQNCIHLMLYAAYSVH